jgi:hypothetical protein
LIRSQPDSPIVKTRFATAAALIAVGKILAAETTALRFGGERIGIPPLSLTESLARGAAGAGSLLPGANLPPASGLESLASAPNLLPRTTLESRRRETLQPGHLPRVSRRSGMPIIEPGDAIDYKLVIVPPNPGVDFKLVIKDPRPTGKLAERK